MNRGSTVYTIGHSTHSVDHFLSLLTRHRVTALADVRSIPASRHTPQFNREPLKRSAAATGIKYVFLGRELGARSNDPACYIDGKVQYDRLARTNEFRDGLGRIIAGSMTEMIAVLCTEKDPLECHRALLVARQLVAAGIEVGHILHDGSVEPHPDSLLRLRRSFGLADPGLFDSDEDLECEAQRRQESRIAYVDEDLRVLQDG